MLRLAWKSVLGNKLRLGLTALAVVLGVAFVAGTFILTDSIDAAFNGLFEEANVGVDVYVNPVSEFDLSGGGPPGVDGSGGATLDAVLLEEVLAVNGVADATGLVQGIAVLVGPDGERLGGQGPPTFGFSWADGDGPITLRAGEAPAGPDDVVIDVTTFEGAGFALGDSITVLLPEGPAEFTIVGTSGFGEEDNLLGATTASFTLERAQEVFGKVGRFDQIAVAAADGVDTLDLKDAIAAVVASDDIEVVSVDEQVAEQTSQLNEGLAFLDYVLLSFAGVSLFVGAFLIVNTFNIVVAQRLREFALLRAVGASSGQLRRMVLLEAGFIGIVGGTLGIAGGIVISEGIQALFMALGGGFPDGGLILAPRTWVASYVIAIGVTVIAAYLPARRASRTAPIEALRGTGAGNADIIGHTRTISGVLLTLAGLVALPVGLLAETGYGLELVGGGVGALFVGVALLAPWIARPVAMSLGRLLGNAVPAQLARRNAARNPTRTAATASALMIGVALVAFISIVAASITASVAALFEEQFHADLVLTAQGGFGTLPRSLADELNDVEGVGSASPIRLTVAQDADGRQLFINGMDPATVEDHLGIGASPGALEALSAPGTVIMDAAAAADEGLVVGDVVELSFAAVTGAELELVGTFANGQLTDGDHVVALSTYEELVGGGSDASISVIIAEGADREVVTAAVEDVAAAYPGTDVQTLNDLLIAFQEGIDQLLNVMIGLLFLALIIAVIGIVNTLALSVLERTREIGLLRAVGMTRTQLRAAVYRESVLVALFGALLGVGIGSFFGWALVTALAEEGIEVLVFPVGRLVVYVVAAAVAGVGAALLPAIRASRLNVLDAITTE